jgi:hypothetical protein
LLLPASLSAFALEPAAGALRCCLLLLRVRLLLSAHQCQSFRVRCCI